MNPDFFLTTEGEYLGLAEPRACYIEGRLSDRIRDDYMLIRIDPPLIGQTFGLGSRDLDQLIISSRFEGTTLFPISHWPAHVYVARILDESIVGTKVIQTGQVELVAWGMLFQSLDEANTFLQGT